MTSTILKRSALTLPVIYLRMSSDELEDGEGVERQRDGALELLADEGADLAAVVEFAEIESAFDTRKVRKAFERLLVAITAGRVSMIVARDYTRLTRNHRDAVRLLDLLLAHGVVVRFTDEDSPDLTGPDGVDAWWRAIEAGRAESARQSKRRRAANAARRARGQVSVGQRPFGYQWTGSAKRFRYTPDLVEGPLVTELFRRIADGKSLSGCAKWLNEQGVTGPRGAQWNSAKLGYLLKNRLYTGRIVHRGELIDTNGVDTWPALVDDDLFDQVQQILSNNRGAGRPGRPAQHLLTGLVHTPDGVPMICARSGGRAYLRTKSGAGPVRSADAVEAQVVKVALERLSRIDLAEFIGTDRGVLEQLTTDRRALLARRADLAVEAGRPGGMSLALVSAADAGITRDLAVVESRIAELANATATSAVLSKYADRPDQAAAIWARSPLDERRTTIRVLFDITVGQALTKPDDGRGVLIERAKRSA
jgi:site-specific DNA recombinase